MLGDIFYITVIVCFLIEVSGVVDTIKVFLFKFINGPNVKYRYFDLKPLDCVLCMTWWCGLVYIGVSGNFGLTGIFYVSIFSMFSRTLSSILILLIDMIGKFIHKLNNF